MNGTLRTANSEMRIDGALLDDAHGFAIGEICRAIGDDARAGGQRLLERGAIIGDARDRDVLLMRHVVAQGADHHRALIAFHQCAQPQVTPRSVVTANGDGPGADTAHPQRTGSGRSTLRTFTFYSKLATANR